MNKAVKNYLYQKLEQRGYTHIIPSHTNFILFEIDQDPETAVQRLEERRILIRTFSFREKSWIRVSLGTRAEVQAFTSALSEIA
jgi:histidinol-phosphate aminotransferase